MPGRQEEQEVSPKNAQALRTCEHCGVPYSWMRSPASLKMTYCGSLCEQADLGFSLESLERYTPPTVVERAAVVAAQAWEEATEAEQMEPAPAVAA